MHHSSRRQTRKSIYQVNLKTRPILHLSLVVFTSLTAQPEAAYKVKEAVLKLRVHGEACIIKLCVYHHEFLLIQPLSNRTNVPVTKFLRILLRSVVQH